MAKGGGEEAGKQQEVHRPGVYKQQNKAHKHGRHRTKGQLDNLNKGNVEAKVVSKKAKRELRRQERRNQAQQLRARKREELLTKKRGYGGSDSSPFLTCVIALSASIQANSLIDLIKKCDYDGAEHAQLPNGHFHLSMPRFRQRFTFFTVPSDDIDAVLDAAKVADTVLFLYPSNEDVDDDAELVFAALFAQGLPATVHATVCPSTVPQKKRSDMKQNLAKSIEKRFPKEKLHFLEKESDVLTLVRQIGSQKQRTVFFRDKRAHLLAEKAEFESGDGDLGTLKITGYVRGQPFSVNRLVHFPLWGTYRLKQIDGLLDARALNKSGIQGGTSGDVVLKTELPNPDLQETLESENVPDPMQGEQTWPTDEELKAAEEEQKKKRMIRVPKGMSDYQAAWIIDHKDNDDLDEEEEGVFDEELGCAEMETMDEDHSDGDKSVEEEEEYETLTVTEAGDEAMYDDGMDLNEEHETLQKVKDARMDEMFPDEVDTPLDVPARKRFQKFRGLKSFRTSPWDPKENLPTEYARLFQFQSYDRTRKRILKDESLSNEQDVFSVGLYVTLYVENFPRSLWETYQERHPLVVYQPLPYEQKMSVLNVVLKRCPFSAEPIRSKEKLVFHVGYRRFSACPIFSQHTNGTKHKYERFFRNDSIVVATVYAPITFAPCPVLMFKEKSDGTQEFVAMGSVLNVNPDRIVGKRSVLSGHTLKINKSSAVVRYMFFNKEDIEWFKPVELRTKCGRRGHIKESLGTHGHMKCYFDGQLRSHDTILMNLYKRMFPKWTYEPVAGSTSTGVTGKSNAEDDMENVDDCELFD